MGHINGGSDVLIKMPYHYVRIGCTTQEIHIKATLEIRIVKSEIKNEEKVVFANPLKSTVF